MGQRGKESSKRYMVVFVRVSSALKAPVKPTNNLTPLLVSRDYPDTIGY